MHRHQLIRVTQCAQNAVVQAGLHDRLRHRAQQGFNLGDLDVLALAIALTVIQGHLNCKCTKQGRIDIGIGLLHAQDPFAFIPDQAIQARQPCQRGAVGDDIG